MKKYKKKPKVNIASDWKLLLQDCKVAGYTGPSKDFKTLLSIYLKLTGKKWVKFLPIKEKQQIKDIEDLARDLKEMVPKSEVWFLSKIDLFQLHWNFRDTFEHNKVLFDKYIGDFVSEKFKIIIEVDGSIHNRWEIKTKDHFRTKYLNNKGYHVFRVKHNDMISFSKVISEVGEIISGTKKDIKKTTYLTEIKHIKTNCKGCKIKLELCFRIHYDKKWFNYCQTCFGKRLVNE